jgi:hypothetical protein
MFHSWHTLILGSLVEFNGSSISVLSRNSVMQIEREFAMVDGAESLEWLEVLPI